MFSIQYGRSSDVDENPTYQVIGRGLESLANVSGNISEIASRVEAEFREVNEFSTHRPFVRAHASLVDGSVLYTGVYYYGISEDSVKRFELRIFHPDIPFGVDRYDEIFDASPVTKPMYLEEAKINNYRISNIPENATQVVMPTVNLSGTTNDMVAIENPITSENVDDDVWRYFKSPNQLFAKSYIDDGDRPPLITDFRFISVDDLEPIFYEAEIEQTN